MRKLGFEDINCWLEPREVTPADPRSFVQTVCVVRHLDPLPEELHDQFVDRVLELYEHPFVLHYPGNAFPTDTPRPQLNTWNLQKYSNNSVFDNELWGANFGVLR